MGGVLSGNGMVGWVKGIKISNVDCDWVKTRLGGLWDWLEDRVASKSYISLAAVEFSCVCV